MNNMLNNLRACLQPIRTPLSEYVSLPHHNCNIPALILRTIKYQNRIKRMKRIVSNVLINYPLQHSVKPTMRNAHSITKMLLEFSYRWQYIKSHPLAYQHYTLCNRGVSGLGSNSMAICQNELQFI